MRKRIKLLYYMVLSRYSWLNVVVIFQVGIAISFLAVFLSINIQSSEFEKIYLHTNLKNNFCMYSDLEKILPNSDLISISPLDNWGMSFEAYFATDSCQNKQAILQNDTLISHYKLPVEQGEWFYNDYNSNICQAIVSKELSEQYKCNHTYQISLENIDNNQVKKVQIKIIGVLSDQGYYLAGSGPRFCDVFKKNLDGLIIKLPNDHIYLKNKKSMNYFLFDNSIEERRLNRRFSSIGKFFVINDLYNKYQQDFFIEMAISFLIIIILLRMLFASINGYSLLQIEYNKEKYSLYYTFGATWRGCIGCMLYYNLALFLIPFLLEFCVVLVLKSMCKDFISMLGFFYASGICFCIYLLGLLYAVIALMRKKPMQIMLEEEIMKG